MVAAVQENQGATVNYTLTHDIFYGAGPTAYSFRFVFFFFLTSNVELHEVMFHQKQSCITDSVQCIFFFFFVKGVLWPAWKKRDSAGETRFGPHTLPRCTLFFKGIQFTS